MENRVKGKKGKEVLVISAVIVAAFVLFGAIFPEQLKVGADWLFSVLTQDFGWFYLFTVFGLLLFALYVAFSRYGKIKLGKDDDKPEFTNFQWFTMLFGGGMGIGLVFWSVAEPIMDYMSPPSATPETTAAMYESMKTMFFHWGFHPWVIYAVAGLGLGYFAFRKDKPFLVSSALEPLIGDKVHGPLGKAVDILAVFATIFGVATSLGLGASQIVGGLGYVYGIESTTVLTCIIIAIITVIFTIATMTGLQKGIQLVADIKIWLSIAFMVFIFLFGGAVFICDLFTNTFGGYLGGIITKSLWMENKSFVSGWTVFYWAWWIAWAPFCGQFVARVSKGRSIRQYILAVMLLPAGFGFIWLAIYGGAAFNLNEITGGLIQAAVGTDYTTGLFALLQQLPVYALTAPLAIALIAFCFLGSANSATYVLAMLTSNGDMDPSKKLRAGWGIAQGAVTIVCIIVGGTAILSILQTVSIVAAFPYMFVMIFMCIAIMKALRLEFEPEIEAKVKKVKTEEKIPISEAK
ncbi:MAG TPA: BCCT family transporter [Clostridiales bacterium]|nr:BCCT family transporter [Clostridiales bacterium]